MNSVFEANSFVVKLARVYPPEAAPKATRAVLGNLFEEALAIRRSSIYISGYHASNICLFLELSTPYL